MSEPTEIAFKRLLVSYDRLHESHAELLTAAKVLMASLGKQSDWDRLEAAIAKAEEIGP